MKLEQHELRLEEAVQLAHATVAHVAAGVGIRVLSIKGPFAAHYGLREPRVSVDADILVEPGKAQMLHDALARFGWHKRAGRMPPTFFGLHSITMINDSWPCDIDLHHFFPGFFASPEDVFERLWTGRDVHSASRGQVITPSRAGMAVIVALHAARAPYLEKSQRDWKCVGEAMSHTFSQAELHEFRSIAEVGRALWVLRELLADVDMPVGEADVTSAEVERWSKNQIPVAEKSAALWLGEVAGASLFQKVGVFAAALWVPRADIPRNDTDRLPTVRESLAFQRERWARGARYLLDYMRR